MALNGAGSSRNAVRAATNSEGHNKRPWTASEDMTLVQYIQDHGEGNWNSVQLNSGLNRSGKSCRLRWANHLRPNLKKDPFSPDEERLIFELHEQLGGKWSRIAAQLPGRTDNEIKNFWNIRYKRHKRTGLPINPRESGQEDMPPNTSPSQSSFQPSSSDPSYFLNMAKSPLPNDASNGSNYNTFFSDQLSVSRSSTGDWALSLRPSLASFSSSSPFIHTFSTPMPITSIQDNSLYPGLNPCHDMMVSEPPSVVPQESGTAALAFFSGDNALAMPSIGTEDYKEGSLFAGERIERQPTMDLGDLHTVRVGGFHGCGTSLNDNIGSKAPGESNIFMDDELSTLLNSFPLTVPIPDWNDCDPCDSMKLMNSTFNESENWPIISQNNQTGTSSGTLDQHQSFGSCFWNKLS